MNSGSQVHKIAAMPGDGIGKEVMPEGLRVLDAASFARDNPSHWRNPCCSDMARQRSALACAIASSPRRACRTEA
jgi:isocitrate/isopropylmalate dehydrogenase